MYYKGEVREVGRNSDKIADAEAEIMKVVWKENRPLTFSEIRTALNETFDWGNQVINTMVKRLVKKGALKQEKEEVYLYSALISEGEYRKSKTDSLVRKVYGGDIKGLLSALVDYEEVTQEDLEDLQGYWEENRRRKGE